MRVLIVGVNELVVLGRPVLRFYVPPEALGFFAAAVNKRGAFQSLCGLLLLNISKAYMLLWWPLLASLPICLRLIVLRDGR